MHIGLAVVDLCVSIVSVQVLSIIGEEIEQVPVKAVTDCYTPEVVEHKAAAAVIHRVITEAVRTLEKANDKKTTKRTIISLRL